jgi:hypothetical protein
MSRVERFFWETLLESRQPIPMTDFTHDSVRLRRRSFAGLAGCLILALFPHPLSAEDATKAPTSDAPDHAVEAIGAQADTPLAEANPSISLRGSVWRTKAGIVFLKTPVGTLTLSSKTTLKDLKASHEVTFWVHERNSVVEVRKRSDGSLVHRYLSGPMTPGPDSTNTLRWWTVGGEQTVHVGTQEEKLASYHDGDPLTVEVDEDRTILGVHDLQFDLQISQIPPSGSQAQLLISGTVSKLKSKFVFFRTPIGVVMVNAKIGLPKVKVGQYMTLRIANGQVDVGLGKTTKPLPRTGTEPASSTSSPS